MGTEEVAARLEALRLEVERTGDPGEAVRALRSLLVATQRAIDLLSLQATDSSTAESLRRKFLGREAVLEKVVARIARAAGTSLPVLIEGPPDSGRALVASAIHRMSPRGEATLRTVDGASLGDAAALNDPWEEARGGSLLLTDVDRLGPEAQLDLIGRLGTDDPTAPRLLTTTARDLAEDTAGGLFREDLQRRLFVLRLRLPTPRPRDDDRPTLQELERESIAARLADLSWHQQQTADSLGIDRKTLYRKIREYGLRRLDPPESA